jgi:aquaporin related protein
MHPRDTVPSSTRSSGALPYTVHIGSFPRPPSSMAQPHLPTSTYVPDRAPPALPEGESPLADEEQRNDDSVAIKTATPVAISRSRSNTVNRDRKQSNAASTMEQSHMPQVDFDLGDDASTAPPPLRNPSRQQMMRYPAPPTPSEPGFAFDDPDHKYWPRPPYDYGVPIRAPSQRTYWGEEPHYYNRPYQRRMSSLRESDEYHAIGGGRGPPRPPRSSRKDSYYDDGESDEQPLRKPRRKRSARSDDSSPAPPEVIMRLPFTTWMNRTAKGRTYNYQDHSQHR